MPLAHPPCFGSQGATGATKPPINDGLVPSLGFTGCKPMVPGGTTLEIGAGGAKGNMADPGIPGGGPDGGGGATQLHAQVQLVA